MLVECSFVAVSVCHTASKTANDGLRNLRVCRRESLRRTSFAFRMSYDVDGTHANAI